MCQSCSAEPLPHFAADNMPTRNVVLSEHQHELVETLVQSGHYQNASEVLREGCASSKSASASRKPSSSS